MTKGLDAELPGEENMKGRGRAPLENDRTPACLAPRQPAMQILEAALQT